jgi:hypothetical protein
MDEHSWTILLEWVPIFVGIQYYRAWYVIESRAGGTATN